MKIVCTLTEFAHMLSQCPRNTALLSDDDQRKYLNVCDKTCAIKGNCIYDEDWELNSEMFTIVPEQEVT